MNFASESACLVPVDYPEQAITWIFRRIFRPIFFFCGFLGRFPAGFSMDFAWNRQQIFLENLPKPC